MALKMWCAKYEDTNSLQDFYRASSSQLQESSLTVEFLKMTTIFNVTVYTKIAFG
ncbi:hypothetical protein KP509_32G041300 [Ceratopteris richardii]|uniref:Uncharacterized protein n=1 Tax=Ceratopteris richardii TaxID=49495 RepID=A0A8T2QV05_CERRI|nr:hypothetical protein KP509_32G041300 [Ceratopteris richardii]